MRASLRALRIGINYGLILVDHGVVRGGGHVLIMRCFRGDFLKGFSYVGFLAEGVA